LGKLLLLVQQLCSMYTFKCDFDPEDMTTSNYQTNNRKERANIESLTITSIRHLID
jgi:hypothetical protein